MNVDMNYFKRIKGEKKMKREIEERNSRVEATRLGRSPKIEPTTKKKKW